MLGYIISDKYEINVKENEIFSFDILHKTDLNIFVIENNELLYLNNIILNASSNGHIQVLEWFKNSGYEFKYGKEAINRASYYGHIQVLEWFKNSGYEFNYDKNAFIYASLNGHIQVLEWFKNYGYKFKYDKWAINEASCNGHIQVLKFYSYHINVKKLIIWRTPKIFIKTIKFKTNNKYLKGYQKN
jgi:hypothetical protein